MTQRFDFKISATDGKARTGSIQMLRGEIRTPAFMPVGTAATVKGDGQLIVVDARKIGKADLTGHEGKHGGGLFTEGVESICT